MLHGSSTTWFQTSRYCRAQVEFNSIYLARHGSSTTFETGLVHGGAFFRNFTVCSQVSQYASENFDLLEQGQHNVFGTHVFLYVLVGLAEAQKLGPGAHNWEKHNNRSFTNLMI